MRTISEVSRLTGVSVRALHYYDSIGLLKPDSITGSGYRLYGDGALERLEYIMLFRELEFPLDEIRALLDSPGFGRDAAVDAQIRLLELKRERIDRIIGFARSIKTIGVNNMDFSAFNSDKIKQYSEQAKKKWGDTEAYREFEKKNAGKSEQDMKNTNIEMMSIFAELGKLDCKPEDAPAQELIGKLRGFITANFYSCTPEILAGLGEMYAAGGEMTDNIDRAGGEGTAKFAAEAIRVYVRGK